MNRMAEIADWTLQDWTMKDKNVLSRDVSPCIAIALNIGVAITDRRCR